MADLTRTHNVSVRFIEEMPFNGDGAHEYQEFWNYRKILEELKKTYPGIYKLPDPPASTSYNYQIRATKAPLESSRRLVEPSAAHVID